jgi:hypothetical protein
MMRRRELRALTLLAQKVRAASASAIRAEVELTSGRLCR